MMYHSSFEMSYFLLPLIGFIIGMSGAMLGSGGGFFFLPILTLLFGVPAHVAVVTSLSAALPVCMVGSYGNYQKGNIEIRTAVTFALAGILGALFGAYITKFMTQTQLKMSFGIYALAISVIVCINTWRKQKREHSGLKPHQDSVLSKVSKGSFFGFIGGMIAGTFGTSGSAPVQAGLITMNIPLKLVLGTSLAVVMVNTIFAIGGHLMVGAIDLTLIFCLTIGSALGAIVGARVLSRIDFGRKENGLRFLFGMVMAVTGLLMIVNA
jgi:uncharacterized membrane protein YfcA